MLNGKRSEPVDLTKPLIVSFVLSMPIDIESPSLFCIIEDAEGKRIIVERAEGRDLGSDIIERGRHRISVKFPPLWLNVGVYSLYLKLVGNTVGTRGRFLSERVTVDANIDKYLGGSQLMGILNPPTEWYRERI
jgi:hypothetical protein